MNEVVNKKALADVLVEKAGLKKKDAVLVIDTLLDEVKDTLKAKGTVDLAGFGKFVVKHRDARTGINPATKEKVEIAAKDVPTFKPAKGLKDLF